MSAIRDHYGLCGHEDIGTTWNTNRILCMRLKITHGLLLEVLPGLSEGLLEDASRPSRIVNNIHMDDSRIIWTTGIPPGLPLGLQSGVAE